MDREDDFRYWVRGVFKQQHVAEVQSASHPSDAQSLLCRHEVHIALVELAPEMAAGLHFLRWMRDRKSSPCPDLPILLVIKTIDRATLERACAVGVQGVLRKPVSGDQLLKMVASACRNPRPIGFSGDGRPATAPRHATPPAPQPPQGAVAPRASHGGAAASGVIARPSLPGSGGRRVDDVALPDGEAASKPKQFLETAPPAAKPKAGDGWGDALGEEAVKKKPSGVINEAPLAPPARKKPEFIDEGAAAAKKKRPAGIDEPPPPPPTKPPAETGPDIDAVLEEHANWVRSGGGQGRRATLEGQDLSGRSLEGGLLTNAVLRRSDLSGCDCRSAEMQGADLRNTEIFGGNFCGANLAVARLRHAKLRGCQFEQANLNGADLAGADLTEAKFGDADLKGANLLGVDLSGADLSGVSGLTQAQLENATGDAKTRLPPGLLLPQAKAEG